jgi:hypothetical protein
MKGKLEDKGGKEAEKLREVTGEIDGNFSPTQSDFTKYFVSTRVQFQIFGKV